MRRPRGPGGGSLHVIALVASFAIAGAALVGWFDRPRDVPGVLIWFAAAILLHDVLLLPLYTLLDRVTVGWLHRRVTTRRSAGGGAVVNPAPYLRVPAITSALLFAVLFPVILGLGSRTELTASGIGEHGYLGRWLAACGALFAASGLAYVIARARSESVPPAATPDRGGRIG